MQNKQCPNCGGVMTTSALKYPWYTCQSCGKRYHGIHLSIKKATSNTSTNVSTSTQATSVQRTTADRIFANEWLKQAIGISMDEYNEAEKIISGCYQYEVLCLLIYLYCVHGTTPNMNKKYLNAFIHHIYSFSWLLDGDENMVENMTTDEVNMIVNTLKEEMIKSEFKSQIPKTIKCFIGDDMESCKSLLQRMKNAGENFLEFDPSMSQTILAKLNEYISNITTYIENNQIAFQSNTPPSNMTTSQMSRFYMKGKKILDANGRLYATIEKTNEQGRYDMYSANGSFMYSIFNYGSGFGISSTTSQDNISVYASKEKSLQIGIGPRILPKPIIPLANLPYGSYTGAFGQKSLVITKKTVEVDRQVVAQYSGANVGFGNAFLSGYTYRHQYIDISDAVFETNKYVAIYAYLFYIRN